MVKVGKIEKNVPIPGARRASANDLGLHDLRVGESKSVKGTEMELKAARASAYRISKAKGWKMVTRNTTDGGIRIWREE